MNIVERYNIQKGKENRYNKSGIDNYIANRLKIREILEQKEINKTIEQTIKEQIIKSLNNILK